MNPSRHRLSYPRAIRFLYDLQRTGIKLGLQNTRRLLRMLGNPHHAFTSLHIAGSNGKGSTAAMIASVLTAAGYRTGLYTSPHLVSFTERVRINGRPIPQREVARITARIRPVVERYGMTFFEATTAMAFCYFADQEVDVAVIETGLGGRLDATNVLRPLLSVITQISREHQQILGNTVAEITYEKAGIIKRNSVCVTGATNAGALNVIRAVCRKRKTRLVPVAPGSTRIVRSSQQGSTLVIRHGSQSRRVFVSLPGVCQARNAALAIASLEEARRRFSFDDDAIRKGLRHIERYTGFRGRLSVLGHKPLVLADVAHNPAAMQQLAATLKKERMRDLILVFGVMKDKDVRPMIRALKPLARMSVVVQARTERSRASGELLREFTRQSVPAVVARTVVDGLKSARTIAGSSGTVLVTGSHFVVGEALAFLEGKKYLTINQ